MSASQNQTFAWPILSDRYSLEDQLGYEDYCDVLSMAVQQADTPISIGILGDWGSGKTSLMRMLESRLNEGGQCITVWFDAWKFTKEEVLWRSFLLSVITDLRLALEEKNKLDEQSREQFDHWEQRIYEALDLERMGELTLDWKKAASGATALVSSVIPFGSVLTGVVDKLTGAETTSKATEALLKGDLNAVKDLVDLVHREKIEIHQRQMKFMEDFQKEFEAIIKAYRTSDENARLVVFVDDLDRCLPEKAVQVLEAIKLFLEVEGTVFVLGVAQEVVQRGIEVWYQIDAPKDGDESPFSGKKYLEKIIQLPFRLPALEPEQFVKFIEANCQNMPDYCAQIFGCGLEANPRKAKRLVNVFGLQLALGQKRIGDDLKPWLLAKLNVIQERWPKLYTYLVTWPAEIKTLEQACRENRRRETIRENLEMEESRESKETSTRTFAPTISEYAGNHALQEMMCCEIEQCSAQDISLSVLKRHVHLTETIVSSSSKTAKDLEDLSLWQQLISETPEEQNEALEKIKELSKPEQQSLRRHIKSELETNALFELTSVSRASALKGLALIGDPRQAVLDSASMEFCRIASGSFSYGEGDEAEQCQELDHDYYLAKYPVTVSQFRQFSKERGYAVESYWLEAQEAGLWQVPGEVKFRQDEQWRKGAPELSSRFAFDNHPMVMISWYEGLAYCRWLTQQWIAGKLTSDTLAGLDPKQWIFSLPTEKQWEKAARGGQDKRVYPFEGEITSEKANYSKTGISGTSAVGCFPKGESPYGCQDMAGNVWEWCLNKHSDGHSLRVVRGGSWSNSAGNCRCSYRDWSDLDNRNSSLGFRVALVPSS